MPPEASRNKISPEQTQASKGTPGRRRWRRILVISLGILVGLGVIVRLAAPMVLRRAILSVSPEFVNGRIELENIDLSVMMGRIEIDNLVLYSDKAPDASLLRVRKLVGDIGWEELLEGHIHIDEILLDAPEIDLAIDAEGRLNWEDLPVAGEETPEEPTSGETSPLVVRLAKASIRKARLRIVDAREGAIPSVLANLGSFRITGLDLVHGGSGDASSSDDDSVAWGLAGLDLSDWRIGLQPADGKSLEFVLTLHSEGLKGARDSFPVELQIESDAGRIDLEADLTVTPLAFDGTLTWTGLVLPRLLALAPVEGIQLESAESDGHLELSLGPSTPNAATDGPESAPALALSVSGKFGLREVDVAIAGESPLTATWETLDVGLEKLAVAPIGGEEDRPPIIDVALSTAELARPRVEFVLAATAGTEDGEPESAPEGATEAHSPPEQPDSAAAQATLRLASLKLSDGVLRFEDQTLTPPFKYTVGELEVAASDTEWPSMTLSKLDLSLAAGGLRPVTLTGTRGPETGRFQLEIEALPLLPFNPYLKTEGVFFTQGSLSLKSNLALTGAKYTAKNDFTFDTLAGHSIGDSFAGRFGVPLGVAITLLENAFGKIELAVPFEGDVEDGGVQLVDATGTALRRSLTNALATPVSMLAATVLPDSDESRVTFTLVPFAPGNADLSRFAGDQLENHAQLLSSDARFHANLWPQLSLGDAVHMVPNVDWAPGEGARQIAPDDPSHAKLAALADARASAVSSRLQTKFAVPEERIQVIAWDGQLVKEPAGLRMGFSDGKLNRGLLERATERLKSLF